MSVIGQIVIYWTDSVIALRNQNLINEWRLSGYKKPPLDWDMNTASDKKIKNFTSIGKIASYLALGFLFTGIAFLIIFVSVNLYAKNSNQIKGSQTTIINNYYDSKK